MGLSYLRAGSAPGLTRGAPPASFLSSWCSGDVPTYLPPEKTWLTWQQNPREFKALPENSGVQGWCGSCSMPAIWRIASTACVVLGVAASSGPGYVLLLRTRPDFASILAPMHPACVWLSLALVPHQGHSCACVQRWSSAPELARGAPPWCTGDYHTHTLSQACQQKIVL